MAISFLYDVQGLIGPAGHATACDNEEDRTMLIKAFAPLIAAGFLLSACVTDSSDNQTIGTIIGGIGGAVLGSQVGGGSGRLIATAVGTLAGALIGNEVGKSLGPKDKAEMQKAEETAHVKPIGETVAWTNPDSGNSGTVTPVREGRSSQTGARCREYQTTVNADGKDGEAFGTVCQQPDGSWKIVKS
jgi:surface antigen